MRSRRAISSVVGMVFAIIALSSTFVYISYSMNTLSNYNQSVLQKNQQLTDVNKEKFQITSVTFANSKFNITVANTGNLPLNFTKIWIQNMSISAGSNWDKSYVPTNSFVSPGGTVTNIGQSFQGVSKTFDTTKSYNIKLVTTRGNTQQFTVNSASAAPLNIQFLAIPPTVSVGFKTELLMIVTNNGSSILTNISPTALPNPATTGSASCSAGSVSPSTFNNLAPGSTAIFKWDVSVTAGNDGNTCTYTVSPPLQNGYTGQSVSATITATTVKFGSTTLAANVGILTVNYTNFRWTQGNTWNTGWQLAKQSPTAFSIKLTNNNATAGTNFYISKNSVMILYKLGTATSTPWYITQNVTLGATPSVSASQQYANCPAGTNDYCVNIPPQGSATIYFAASGVGGGGTAPTTDNAATPEPINLILLGKYAATQGGSGTLYAQNIPSIAVNLQ